MSEEAAPVAVAVAVAAPAVELDLRSALQDVMKKSTTVDGLRRGLREATKALDRKEAIFAVLADDCDEAAYKKLIESLCKNHGIPLITGFGKHEIGELGGLAKRNAEGSVRKNVKCSCAVVTDFGDDSTPAAQFIKSHISKA
ncbi:40S small subunit ribosomal protein eS12 (rpS12) [Andalucia godoyi]|uniref:40S ribosomal protein S12 n=1 Tax=Andalucia godoyi TaxID=505711 RepID=A0A8K0AK27_ANDGO|nr:40S small subunit ribosomal protein eS12 (rpS12) [Andalucia godoyi]|eukprot:ANDGO_07624.mRNA.1 40S small subunit ribosomal protein eS12 (rpS12)